MRTDVWAIAMVKDEADVAPVTVAWMASQVDRVLVADNGSTDGTRDLLERIPGVTVIDDPDPAYYQAEKMTRLAERAAAERAAWVVPFDADEVWRARSGGRLADVLCGLPRDVFQARATLYDHIPTSLDAAGPPVMTMGWRHVTAGPFPKVAVRTRPGLQIQQGNHACTHRGRQGRVADDVIEVRHFPYRTVEQLIRKVRNGAAAYALTTLPDDLGAHWREWGRMTDTQLRALFMERFWSGDPVCDPDLIYDPVPL